MERLLSQIHGELQTVEKTLSGNKTSYMFDGDAKICINCGDVCGNSAKYCYSCRSGNLTIKCCTKDHRIAEYFAALRASRLWPSLEPFQSCSTEEIASRISLASNSVNKHNCKAGYCPLKQQLDNLVKKVNVIIGKAKGLTLSVASGIHRVMGKLNEHRYISHWRKFREFGFFFRNSRSNGTVVSKAVLDILNVLRSKHMQ